MNDLVLDDPCLLFALRRERGPFHKEFPANQRFPGAPCWARFCGPAWLSVLVLEMGMGPEHTRRTLDWLLSKPTLGQLSYAPRLILCAGFAGALTDDLLVGDLVLATEIVAADGRRWPTTWPGDLPEGRWQPPLRRGPIVTVPNMVADPADKRSLGAQHRALAVDMESATCAQLCSERGVPFGVVRAISDDMHTPLSPRLATILSGGQVSWWRMVLALLRQPTLIKECARLARHTRLAAQQLALALGELLTLTLPWNVDD